MGLAVSILAQDFESLSRRALAAAATADLVELRLDRLATSSEAQLAALFARLGKPALVALNGPESYGSFEGSAQQRRDVLERAARAGAAFVDVDWRQAAGLAPLPGKTQRVVSRHEREVAGDVRALERELRAAARPGDRCKLVVEARSGTQALEVLALLADSPGDLIAFAAGAQGSFSRILAPILGSPWTYAAPDPLPGEALAPSAPGQLSVAQMRAAWPLAGPRASTAIFAVLGSPIAHSISPRVHTAALRAEQLDAVFVAVEVEQLEPALAALRAPNWRGLAVTAPHKQAAFAHSHAHDAASLRARASNTLLRDAAGWHGSNTDVAAVRALLRAWKGPAAPRALVLGAGGAARAALGALEAAGWQASIAARDLARAQALAREFGARALAWEQRGSQPFDLLLQCTPASGELFPEASIPPHALVIDAVYGPRRTALIEAALRRGAAVRDGGEWFLEQARAQFGIFHARVAPEAAMREELQRALG